MDRLRIRGGKPLQGSVPIGGAKNAALPLMAASLLTAGTVTLSNVPATLVDIKTMRDILCAHGVEFADVTGAPARNGCRTLALSAHTITNTTADYELVRRMRASVLVLGPLLARFGKARVSLPGGCAIGTRPINLHLVGLQAMGAELEIADGYVEAAAPHGLHGAVVRFPSVSVGATEHLMMAAALAKGETVLENAALEPEIIDLAKLLQAMGASVAGAGTSRIVIQGAAELHGAAHHVVADRIEAGTYAVAGAITGGQLELEGVSIDLLGAVIDSLRNAGVEVRAESGNVWIWGNGRPKAVDITTAPFPAFPTDMQAQMMALMTVADGSSVITETIFENRFMHVPELARMGANITVKGNTAVVRGVAALKGAPVMATDLRASVSLVIAALVANGETVVNRVYHLDRGYERLVEKLSACGADIERLAG